MGARAEAVRFICTRERFRLVDLQSALQRGCFRAESRQSKVLYVSYKFCANTRKFSFKNKNSVRNGVNDLSMVIYPMRFLLAASGTKVARHGRPSHIKVLSILALMSSTIISLMPTAQGATPDSESKWMLIDNSCLGSKYPLESRLNGHQGTTFLQFRISADGSVKSIRIEKSSGHRELDLTAQRNLAMCRFKALADVTPDSESEWMPMRYNWTLQ
jgi:TonB family protein